MAEMKRKKPTKRKNVAKNRYRERLLRRIAKKAQNTPTTTKKKALSMETLEMPVREPMRKAVPRNISSKPIIKISLAAVRRVNKRCIVLSISEFVSPANGKMYAKDPL
jgi:hypothetical protein